MKKTAHFIVEKRSVLLLVMLALAAVCAILATRVDINSDMTKYLPEKSSMKMGLDIMQREFPAEEERYTIRVMFDDLTDSQKPELLEKLKAVEYVDDVVYIAGDEAYNKDNHTLYVVSSKYDYGTKEELSIEKALKNDFSGYAMSFHNDDIGMEDIPLWIIGLALVILLTVLFVMCSSWIEPFLFLASIGVAILLNMGTNIFIGSISEITAAIAALLQLVLSMDYSIILINRYRQELLVEDNKLAAMKSAIVKAFASIASSTMTTVVGLLALVFMSFKIGMDLGVVLAKGVFLSMFCTFTVLPALILLSDKLIRKTAKKPLEVKTGGLATFSFKGRYVISGVFVVLFVAAFLLKGNTPIAYTLDKNDLIAELFPPDNAIVMVYDNADDEAVTAIAESLEGNPHIKSVSSYSTTLGKEYTSQELAGKLADFGGDMDVDFDPALLDIINYISHAKDQSVTMTPSVFLQFISENVMNNAAFADYFDGDLREKMAPLVLFSDPQKLSAPMNAVELAGFLDMPAEAVGQLIGVYHAQRGGSGDETITLPEFMSFVTQMAADPNFAGQLGEDALAKLQMTQTLMGVLSSDQAYTATEMTQIFGGLSDELDAETMGLLYLYYAGVYNSDPGWKLSIMSLFDILSNDIASDARFSRFLDDKLRADLDDMRKPLDEGVTQLRGPNVSRLILTTTFPGESPETTAFLDELTERGNADLSESYHLVGNSVMNREMESSYSDEMNLITLLTAVSILIVILLTFRSFSVPIILVLVIQCGVYLAVSIIGMQGVSIYYLALLIVQCILMGATIDYGILFTSYYREKRKTAGVKDALEQAYHGAIHTILTSGSIMILVTGLLGYCFENPTIGQICQTIAKGALSATILILFILPGLLAAFDKIVAGKGRKSN